MAATVRMSPATISSASTAVGQITAPTGTAGTIDPPVMTTSEARCDQAARQTSEMTITAHTAVSARRRAVMIIGRHLVFSERWPRPGSRTGSVRSPGSGACAYGLLAVCSASKVKVVVVVALW